MRTAQILQATRQRSPEKLALVFGDRRWTYAELDEQSDRVGAGSGARPAWWPTIAWRSGCPTAQSYCSPISPASSSARSRSLSTIAIETPKRSFALEHSGSTTLILHSDKLQELAARRWPNWASLASTWFLPRPTNASQAPNRRRATRVAPLCGVARGAAGKTSHSGVQSAAVVDHHVHQRDDLSPEGGGAISRDTLALCRIQTGTMQFVPEDVHLITTSASHCAASYGQLFPNLFVGGTAVLLNAPTPAEVVRAIQTERVTRCQMLPPELLDLVEHLEANACDVGSLRSVTCGGDVVPMDTMNRFRAVVGFDVTELCGMTETITYATNPPFGPKRLGSVGLAAVETEVRIVDEQGEALPSGETGEIQVRSVSNMVGYWNDTLHTAATMHDGWVTSGDLGRLDDEGYLWFVGRKKEIIIRGGSNISPLEVEEVIDQHPAVHNSGVVGFADRALGQVVVAYVALREKASPAPGEEELRAFVAERIAAYKTPARFILVDALPLGPTGKVDRRELHQRLPRNMAGCEQPA